MQEMQPLQPVTALLTTSAKVAAGLVTPEYDTCRSAATPVPINGTAMRSKSLQGVVCGKHRDMYRTALPLLCNAWVSLTGA